MSTIVSPPQQQIINHKVSEMLFSSSAFKELPAEERRDIQHTTVKIIARIAEEEGHDADFPRFVEGLIEGTFRAIVDASVEQMKAYGEMLRSVARSVDAPEDKKAAAHHDIARGRQQLLSTMVLMGINRIVVTDG